MIKTIKTAVILLATLLLAWLLPWFYTFLFASPSWSPFTLYSCVTHSFASISYDGEGKIAGRDFKGNTYTEQSLCPGAVRIAAQFNDVRQRYTTKTEGVPMTVGNQPVQYFRVSEDAVGNAVVNAVDGQAAQGATSLRLLQSHTLPRVVRAGCGQA